MPSLIYRSPFLYELSMRALYGRHYEARYRAIADLIEPQSTVLDLCCGPAVIYQRHLRHKHVVYTGLDINETFVRKVIDVGGLGNLRDIRDPQPLPRTDYVLMQASLYHFLPDPRPVLSRMLEAATRAVIVAEPIRNLTTSRLPLIGSFSGLLTNAGSGSERSRFTEPDLDQVVTEVLGGTDGSFLINGGREKVYVSYVT